MKKINFLILILLLSSNVQVYAMPPACTRVLRVADICMSEMITFFQYHQPDQVADIKRQKADLDKQFSQLPNTTEVAKKCASSEIRNIAIQKGMDIVTLAGMMGSIQQVNGCWAAVSDLKH